MSRRRAIGLGVAAAAVLGTGIVLGSSPTARADTTDYAQSSQPSGLQGIINYNTQNFNSQVGLFPNPGRGYAPPLGWLFLSGNSNVPQLEQLYCFEPNENWKVAVYLVSSGNSGLVSTGTSILNTITTLHGKYNWHPPWKDEALLGYPTPYGNQNVNPGFCFTSSYDLPLPTLSNGQSYEILQACAVEKPGVPPVWKQPNLNPRSGTNVNATSFDEGLYQVANRFIRGDMATAKNLFDQATAMWDGVGFAGGVHGAGTYRGMYLGIYLYVNKLIGANSPIANAVEAMAWSLQQSNGGISRLYSASGPIYGADNETSNALLLSYADDWISRVQAVAASGRYDLTSPPPSAISLYP